MNIFRITKLTAAALAGIMLGLGATGCRKAEEPAPQPNTGAPASEADRIAIPASGPAAALESDTSQLERLKDKDLVTRLNALKALSRNRKPAPDTLFSTLIECLGDPDSLVRERAAIALASRAFGQPAASNTAPALPALVKALEDPEPRVRQSVAHLLYTSRADPVVVVPALARKLEDPDAGVRHKIAFILGNMGQDAKPAIPALIKALGDEEEKVRRAAASTLATLDPRTLAVEQARIKPVRELLEQLTQGLWHEETVEAVRERGTNALPEMVLYLGKDPLDPIWSGAQGGAVAAFKILGAKAKPAIPMLIDLFKNPQTSVRAQWCLQAIGPDAFPALTNALTNAEKEIRASAISTLDSMDEGQAAVPMLIRSMRDEDGRVRWLANNALARIALRGQQLDQIVPELLKALPDPQYHENYGPGLIRILAAEALARIAGAGQRSDQILPVLLALVQDTAKGPAIRCAVIDALGKPAGQSWPAIKTPEMVKEVLPVLLNTIVDPDARIRAISVNTLGAIAGTSDQAKAIIPALRKTTEDASAEVRANSINILAQLDQEQERVLSMLLKHLKDQNPMVRLNAAGGLVRRGDKSQVEAARKVCLKLIENPGDGAYGQNILICALLILDQPDNPLPEKIRRKALQKIQQSQAEDSTRP